MERTLEKRRHEPPWSLRCRTWTRRVAIIVPVSNGDETASIVDETASDVDVTVSNLQLNPVWHKTDPRREQVYVDKLCQHTMIR